MGLTPLAGKIFLKIGNSTSRVTDSRLMVTFNLPQHKSNDMPMDIPSFQICGREICPEQPTYILAEMACAHEGDFAFACKMVEQAATTGVDAVKFQVFDADELVVPSHALHETYNRIAFTSSQWCEIADMTRSGGMDVIVDVFGPWSLEMASAMRAGGVKVHSTNVSNPYFLRQVTRLGVPVLIGSGGTTEAELASAVQIMKDAGTPHGLIHGFQGYPQALADANLRRIINLQRDHGVPVGFATHADGCGPCNLWTCLLALGLGCSLLEVHFSLDRSESRMDYHSSLLPSELAQFVEAIRQAEQALGDPGYELGDPELKYRSTFKAFVVANNDLPTGHRLELDDLAFKRAETGIVPSRANELIGRRLRESITKDTPLTVSHLITEEDC